MTKLEKLAQLAAEMMNGGEFKNDKWYSEAHRQAWIGVVKAVLEKSKEDE